MKKMFFLISFAASFSASAVQPNELVASNNGEFLTVAGKSYCTHDNTNSAYSFELSEDGDVNSLFALNKTTGEIEQYAYLGWTNHGQLWDSRVFKLIGKNRNFPIAIALRDTQGGGNDVYHLSKYVNQDNYTIQSQDAEFTVRTVSAYDTIFECDKR